MKQVGKGMSRDRKTSLETRPCAHEEIRWGQKSQAQWEILICLFQYLMGKQTKK
jgi:hypothetical protein